MNNTTSPRFLECLIGLQCQVCNNGTNYLIIDVGQQTRLILLNEGYISSAVYSEIWLTEKSQDELKDKLYASRWRA